MAQRLAVVHTWSVAVAAFRQEKAVASEHAVVHQQSLQAQIAVP